MAITTRRGFITAGISGGLGLCVLSRVAGAAPTMSALPGGVLPADALRKFAMPLLVPPAMPAVSTDGGVDVYEIAQRQFLQQVLPPPFPPTPVWGYGATTEPSTFNAPSLTIEAQWNRPVQVTWVNQLVDANGRYRPHLLPVDQTLHWANPPGGLAGRDGMGHDHEPYRGPVPMIVHLHGAHADEESDGFTEAWYLPQAVDIPDGYAREGTWYETFKNSFAAKHGLTWAPGTATSRYPNDQAAGTLFYHDHALGMTRLNVYTGAAGFYLLRGGPSDAVVGLPGPAPQRGDAPGTSYYEIPLAIQDRAFNADGSLFYPSNRAYFEGLQVSHLRIPFAGDPACDGMSDVPPIWNPEFFGNTLIVNGRTWPFLDVERRRYRFRLLNACNSRFLIVEMDRPGLPFWVIGGEGGFLPEPAPLSRVLLAPAERADVIVDFTGVPEGTTITLRNLAPDSPFGGGEPGVDFAAAAPGSTGLVMQFRVRSATSLDASTPPHELVLPSREALPAESIPRNVSLNELDSRTVKVVGRGAKRIQLACDDPHAEPFGPVAAMLGTLDDDGDEGHPIAWHEAPTETPVAGTTETWSIHNFTEDAHPIHLHLVSFEVIERVAADGTTRPPEPSETGLKDTVIAYPDEITRVKATFDKAGRYVWHCHILEHEDNEMMRPLVVIEPTT